MKKQRWRILVVISTSLAVGFFLGVLLAWHYAQEIFDSFSGILSSYAESSRELRALQASRDLEMLRTLRDHRVDDAIRNLEDRLDEHLSYLSNTAIESDLAAEVIGEIRSYRDDYPRQPRPPADPQSPAGLLASARILPVYESGTMVGLRISHIMPDSFWDQTGLQNGDVIVRVDDVSIDSPESSVAVITILSSKSEFRLDRTGPSRVRLLSSTP